MRALDNFIRFLFEHPIIPLGFFFIIIPLWRSIKTWSILKRTQQHGGVLIKGGEFSVLAVYEKLRNYLSDHGISGFRCGDVTLTGLQFAGNKRKYLKIEIDDLLFYVCSFRVGDAQAITFWQVQPLNLFKKMLTTIPLLGRIIKALFFFDSLFSLDMASALTTIIQQDIQRVCKEFEQEGVTVTSLPDRDAAYLRGLVS